MSVLVCVRSGSAVFLVGQTCVNFGSSSGQVRVKIPLYPFARGGGLRRVVGVAAARAGRYAGGGERD